MVKVQFCVWKGIIQKCAGEAFFFNGSTLRNSGVNVC